MSKKPPLPPRTGIEGKILESTGLVGKATVLQVDITYKDSALYQLFKLYYFDLTSDEDRRLREENKVPGVLVYANAAASLRISKEEVPTWLKWQRKEESRSKVSGEQQEYAAKLNLGPGRYYIAVFGNANPLVMTSFTITIRHLPLTLNMQDFDHFWSRMHLKDPIPKNALYAGHDIDSHSLYVVRVRLPDGSVHIGYTSPAMKAPVVSYSTGSPPAWKPFQVNTDFDILTQAPGLRFVEQLQAGIPYNAVPAGQEADGRVLYVVRATVQGKSVNLLKNSLLPGEGGLHRNGATVVAKGGLGILVAPFEVAKGLVPFEILVYQNPTNKSFTPPK
ncbi:hypothetical protein DFJ73DRAFT_64063 [Zopfochytrium polystomum]|nr:hypothetical protein DFJ73DRAFT_64063 [Zopfochytrium polystomum]